MLSTHRIALRLAFLTAPMLLTGALDNCDSPGVCAEIALVCLPGEMPADTDDDGCEDSCVPEATCLAMPVCDDGETQVDSESDCLADDAVCYENSVCGSTIWCTGPSPTTACLDDSECGTFETCDTINFCDGFGGGGGQGDAAPAVCYGRCIVQDQCEAYPSCGQDEVEVSGPSGCLQDDAVCYEATLCGSTIWCTGAA